METVHARGAVGELGREMNGPAFREKIERKFGITLDRAACMRTLRGWCRPQDGQVHTDSKSKLITVLVYLNDEPWRAEGGRLRLLGSENLEDVADEVRPDFGTLLAFRRSDISWHGHLPFEGRRRILQMNWVTSERVAGWEQFRHAVSARAKQLV
jgi:hypothetical protein